MFSLQELIRLSLLLEALLNTLLLAAAAVAETTPAAVEAQAALGLAQRQLPLALIQ